MRLRHHLFFTVFICAATFLCPLLVQAQCHPSPDLSIMDRVFLHYLKQDAEKSKQNIAILPFYQNPAGRADPVFSKGIPIFISDTLSTSQRGVLHPYVSFHAADDLGIKGQALAEVTSAQQLAEKMAIPFVLFGSYQAKSWNTLHIILNLYNHKTKKALSPAVEFETPLDDSFFPKLEAAVIEAFKIDRSAPKISPADHHPPSLRIFKEYVQGQVNAQRYQMNQLKLSEAWLRKARSESLSKYNAVNFSLARVYFMQGLLNKLQKKEFGPQWLKAHEIIHELEDPLNEVSQNQRLLKRFVDFEGLSIQATGAFLRNDLKATNSFSEQALTLVPEDGIMQNLYLQTAQGKVNKNIVADNAVCF